MKMKILYIVFGLGFVFSCQKPLKNVEDYFPQVEINAEKQTDGTVKLTGIITDEGEDNVIGLGFCYAEETTNFPITSNQELISDPAQFQATLSGPFDPAKTYYFKAFVVNGFGRAESQVVAVTGIESVPVIAPCSQTLNTYGIGIQTGTLSTFNAPINGFNKVTYPNSGSFLPFLNLTFSNPPLTGFYTTVTNSEPSSGEVYIYLSNGNTTVVNPGSTVYVNRLSETEFKVEICSSTVTINGSTSSFKTHFVRNY